MKTFMEEYGLIVVAAIVILIFVVVATPIGNALVEGISSAIEGLTGQLDGAFDDVSVSIKVPSL